jgi:hypothetical protein
MSRVAYITCDGNVSFDARSPGKYEHALSLGVIGAGLERVGRTLIPVSWTNPSIDWSQFESAVVGTAWDYMERREEFLAVLGRVSQSVPVLNPLPLLVWNSHKSYLKVLEQGGAPTIETVWLEQCSEQGVRDAAKSFGVDELVVKPCVGAGAWRQARWRIDQAFPPASALPPDSCMVQPVQYAITQEGENSLLFFNRRFSHAVVKKPRAGDYRTQGNFGAIDQPLLPSAELLRAAENAIAIASGPILYGRVDLVRGNDGAYKVMELELIEPYLYPLHAPEMGKRFAAAYMDLHKSLSR